VNFPGRGAFPATISSLFYPRGDSGGGGAGCCTSGGGGGGGCI